MTIIKSVRFAFAAVLAIALCASLPASAASFTLSSTTTSALVAKADRQVCLTSATGVVLPSVSAAGTELFMDFETMVVLGQGTSSTCFIVSRAVNPTDHISGVITYVGPPQQFGSADPQIGSACTASTLYVLPLVNTVNGKIYDCRSSGQWIQIGNGTMSDGAIEVVRAFCTGTSGSAETEYLNGVACSGATTATARYVVPTAGTIANLKVSLSAAGAGGTNKDVLTVYKNASSTALTVTTGTTACATAVAAPCIDLTHSVAVVAGDILTFQWVSATSDTAANVGVSISKY